MARRFAADLTLDRRFAETEETDATESTRAGDKIQREA